MKSLLFWAGLIGAQPSLADTPIKFRHGLTNVQTSNGRENIQRTSYTSGGKTDLPDQIQGKCTVPSEGPIPVEVPCRDVEIELQTRAGKRFAAANVNPRGEFLFAQVPKGDYNLVIRSEKLKKIARVEGVTPGYSYDVVMESSKGNSENTR